MTIHELRDSQPLEGAQLPARAATAIELAKSLDHEMAKVGGELPLLVSEAFGLDKQIAATGGDDLPLIEKRSRTKVKIYDGLTRLATKAIERTAAEDESKVVQCITHSSSDRSKLSITKK
jgi:hypothetical protein